MPSNKKLVMGTPNVLNESGFYDRLEKILSTRVFSNNGPMVKELEALVCAKLNVAHCIAMANATLALELVLQVSDLKGSEVILPGFSFRSTAQSIARAGYKPIFSDVNADDGLIDYNSAHSLLSENTAAIVPVNLYGNLPDIELWENLSKDAGIPLIFDSAHSLFSSYRGQLSGGNGLCEVFSLHATKFINGFEGGLVTTNSEELAERLRFAGNFGFPHESKVNLSATNAKLSEIHAAMAISNLEQIDVILSLNRRNFACYEALLSSWIGLVKPRPEVSTNAQYVVIKVPARLRQEIIEILEQNGVVTRKYFSPGLHRMFDLGDDKIIDLPGVDKLAAQTICMPTGALLEECDIQRICALLESLPHKYKLEISELTELQEATIHQ